MTQVARRSTINLYDPIEQEFHFVLSQGQSSCHWKLVGYELYCAVTNKVRMGGYGTNLARIQHELHCCNGMCTFLYEYGTAMVRVRYEWPGTGTKLVRSDIIRTRFVPRTPTRDEISTKYVRIKHESLKLCGWKVRVWYDPGRTSKLTKHSYHFRTTSGTNVVRNDMMYIRVPFVPGGHGTNKVRVCGFVP